MRGGRERERVEPEPAKKLSAVAAKSPLAELVDQSGLASEY